MGAAGGEHTIRIRCLQAREGAVHRPNPGAGLAIDPSPSIIVGAPTDLDGAVLVATVIVHSIAIIAGFNPRMHMTIAA